MYRAAAVLIVQMVQQSVHVVQMCAAKVAAGMAEEVLPKATIPSVEGKEQQTGNRENPLQR